MADSFEAIDVIYNWLKKPLYPAKGYKDQAPSKGTPETFWVVNHPIAVENQLITSIPIRINIYTQKNDNGMINRAEMKAIKDKVIQSIENGTSPGYLFDIVFQDSFINTDYSEKYDVFVMRFDLTITAN